MHNPHTCGLSPEQLEVLEYLLEREGATVGQGETIRPGAGPGPWELSFAQQRIWFLDQMEPGGSTYNMSAALQLRGHLDVNALVRSLDEIVRRHASLRTTFPVREGRPVQVVAPELCLELPIVELGPAAVGQRARVLASEEASKPFDLARGPLLRVCLLKAGDQEHVLLVTLHHIVSDGWSISVFVRELAVLYEAFLDGHPPFLAELPIQYPDFAYWQRQYLRGRVRERELAYWRERLGGDLPALALPTDRPRPPVQRHFRSASLAKTLSQELSSALELLAGQYGSTLFMVLLAAFEVLLHRLSGQDDVVVGTPVAGRDQKETEGLIGCFLNTLVMRCDLSGNPSFSDLLHRVRDGALGAYDHQQVPFEWLLSELQPERDLSRTPLFQVFFNMLNLPEEQLRLPGLLVDYLLQPEVGSKFDLTVYAKAHVGGIDVRCSYNTDLFDQERIVEVLDQYELLLEQAVEDPARPIAHASLLTWRAADRLPNPLEPLEATWRGAVHELFGDQARRTPDRPALRDPHESWTYAQLRDVSLRLARHLAANGVRRGEVVAIYGHRSAVLVWALLGILEAGAAFLVLDPAYPAARLLGMARAARIRGFLRVMSAGKLPEVLAELAESPSIRCRLDLPRRGDAETSGFLAHVPAEAVGMAVGPDDLAYVGFTSGSAGTPKGVLGRHGPLSHFVPWQRREFGLGENDVFSLLSGLSHDPLQREVFTALQIGASITIPDPAGFTNPDYLVRWMRDESVSVAHLTPAMAELLAMRRSDDSPVRIESLRRVFFIGDVLTRREVAGVERLAPSSLCINHYGTMESERALSYFVAPRPGSHGLKETLPLGRGMKDVQVLVLNAGQGLAGIGELGVIHIRSPHLARGYLDDPALTAERFFANPSARCGADRFFRTSDLGRHLPDGSVEFAGRADSQVVLRGFRIEPGEIESRLALHPGILGAVAVVREEHPGERRLVAYLTRAGNETPGVGSLRDHLRGFLPEFMVPSAFVFLDEFPLNPNGKVDRRKLPVPSAARPELEAAYQEPRSESEHTVAAIFRDVLRLDRVGLRDRFFELGGHSLQLVEVRAKLEERLGTQLPLPELFNHSTIESLARYLDRGRDGGESPRQVERRASRQGAGKERLRQRIAARRRRA